MARMAQADGHAGSSILVVEDDAVLCHALCRRLAEAGYRPRCMGTVHDALTAFLSGEAIDLMLVDLVLPDGDGFQILERVRDSSNVPMIVMSVRRSEQDKIRALDAGADDYVTKPLHSGELLARIRAALRRGHLSRAPRELRFPDGLTVDLRARTVSRDGEVLSLTRTEWTLLEQFLAHPGALQTHDELLRAVWGIGFEGDSHYVRVYVASLRRKLADDAREPRLIATQQGVGYRWIAGAGTPAAAR